MAVLGIRIRRILMFVGLPDPDPFVRGPDPDPSPFLIDVLSGLKECLQNRILTQNFRKKYKILDCWQVIFKKNIFFAFLKSMKKEVGSGVESGSIS
jgi:hypothetical protein